MYNKDNYPTQEMPIRCPPKFQAPQAMPKKRPAKLPAPLKAPHPQLQAPPPTPQSSLPNEAPLSSSKQAKIMEAPSFYQDYQIKRMEEMCGPLLELTGTNEKEC